MQILNTESFLCDFRGPRYLQNKIGFLTKPLVINSNFSHFYSSGIQIEKYRKAEYVQRCVPSSNIFSGNILYTLLKVIKGCQRSSSVKGCPLSNVVFRQRSSSIKVCLPSKVVFRQRLSSVNCCLPSKIIFYQMLSSKTQIFLIFIFGFQS